MTRVTLITGALLAVMAFGGSVGCKSEPSSEIVQRVKAEGAGDVEHSTVVSLKRWFYDKKALTEEIAVKCKAVKSGKPADWPQTTEGRICTAAESDYLDSKPLEYKDNHAF